MQRIFNTVSLMWQLQVITLVNRLIYLLQRLPVVGILIRDQTYAAFRTKRSLGAGAVVLMFGAGLLESLLYFCGMFALPMLLWTEDHYTDRFVMALHMYFCISGVMGAVTGAKVLETNKMKYTAIKLMRIAPTRFMRAILFHRYTTFFLYQEIAFTLVSLFFNFSISHVLQVVGIMTCWRVLCEFLHLAIFQRKGIVLIENVGYESNNVNRTCSCLSSFNPMEHSFIWGCDIGSTLVCDHHRVVRNCRRVYFALTYGICSRSARSNK